MENNYATVDVAETCMEYTDAAFVDAGHDLCEELSEPGVVTLRTLSGVNLDSYPLNSVDSGEINAVSKEEQIIAQEQISIGVNKNEPNLCVVDENSVMNRMSCKTDPFDPDCGLAEGTDETGQGTVVKGDEIEANIDSSEEYHLYNISQEGVELDRTENNENKDEVFSNVIVTLSQQILAVISDNKDAILSEILHNCTDRLVVLSDIDNGNLSVSGSFQGILNLHKELTYLLHSRLDLHKEDKELLHGKTDGVEDKGVTCDIIGFTVTSSGREIKKPRRLQTSYISFDDTLDQTFEEEIEQKRPRNRRGRRKLLRPKKLNARKDSKFISEFLHVNDQKQEVQQPADSERTKSLEIDKTGYNIDNEQSAVDSAERTGQHGIKFEQVGSTEETRESEVENTDGQEILSDIKHNFLNSLKHEIKDGLREFTASQIEKRKYEEAMPYKYFCEMCSFKTKRESHLQKHITLHEGNPQIFKCRECDFKTMRYSTLTRHSIMHSSVLYACSECTYESNLIKQLSRHMKLKHNISVSNEALEKRSVSHEKSHISMNIQCTQCDFVADNIEGFRKHVSTEHKSNFTCPYCDYSTRNPGIFTRHLQTRHTENGSDHKQTFQCEKCSYKTMRKEHFVRHKSDVHSEIRPHLCDLCGMAFKRRDALTAHKITHLDKSQRMYSVICPHCKKGFKSKAHLNEHLAVHSSNRSFLCHICGAAFKTRAVQKKHLQTIHMNPRSYPCPSCQKRFNTKYALKRHQRTHEMDLETAVKFTEISDGLQQNLEQNLQEEFQPSMQTNIQTISQEQLSQLTVQTIQTVDGQQETFVSINDAYDQNEEIRQTFITGNETTTALLYLTNMQPTDIVNI
ncbi:hypothetical protein CHS0354_014536 [Potamilus streckersoni]|uniref:C2H2-type domain-containing protein n=1 Tax=Potamilus streckersoni TaxID=2493646 RepID=A0AAE0S9S7_9BIVA|nr:hypothetical protein CHS0354_014536 [Potamilus streckersoni]